MAAKINWAKYIEDREKLLTQNVSDLSISSKEDENEAGVEKSNETGLLQQGIPKENITVQRQNPNSPLYLVRSFEALKLKTNLLKGIYKMGFNIPSKFQETALPALLADPPQNLIAESPSGTGKTVTFVLAMLNGVQLEKKYPQVLCLLPTYQLAIQTGEVAAHMAKFCPEIEMKYAVRGEEVPRGSLVSEHIVIGTPGKVLDWGIKYKVFDLKKIQVFVLDEADVMITTQGHQEQCIRIHKLLDPNCQMMFFSTKYDEKTMDIADIIVPDALKIWLKRE